MEQFHLITNFFLSYFVLFSLLFQTTCEHAEQWNCFTLAQPILYISYISLSWGHCHGITDFFRELPMRFVRRSFHLLCFDCPNHILPNHIYYFLNNSTNLPHTYFTIYFFFAFSWEVFCHFFFSSEKLKWQVILQNRSVVLLLITFSLLGWKQFVSVNFIPYVSSTIFSVSPVEMTFRSKKIPPAHPYSMPISITFTTCKYLWLYLSSLSSPLLPSLSS